MTSCAMEPESKARGKNPGSRAPGWEQEAHKRLSATSSIVNFMQYWDLGGGGVSALFNSKSNLSLSQNKTKQKTPLYLLISYPL